MNDLGKLDGYYPGSLTPVRDYADSRVAGSVQPEDDSPDLGEPVKTEDGMDYFTIGAFARALNRQPGTIRKLEAEGVIPPARWGRDHIQGKGTHRLYSRKQIEDTVRIAAQEGILTQTWKPIIRTRFRERVQEIW